MSFALDGQQRCHPGTLLRPALLCAVQVVVAYMAHFVRHRDMRSQLYRQVGAAGLLRGWCLLSGAARHGHGAGQATAAGSPLWRRWLPASYWPPLACCPADRGMERCRAARPAGGACAADAAPAPAASRMRRDPACMQHHPRRTRWLCTLSVQRPFPTVFPGVLRWCAFRLAHRPRQGAEAPQPPASGRQPPAIGGAHPQRAWIVVAQQAMHFKWAAVRGCLPCGQLVRCKLAGLSMHACMQAWQCGRRVWCRSAQAGGGMAMHGAGAHGQGGSRVVLLPAFE